MVMTLMPMGARSRAMGRVIPTMPPFEAEYAAWPTWNKNGEGKKKKYKLSDHSVISLTSVCVSNDLSVKGCHAGCVNDAASVSVCIGLVLPHLAHGKANHIKGSRDVHLQKAHEEDSHVTV